MEINFDDRQLGATVAEVALAGGEAKLFLVDLADLFGGDEGTGVDVVEERLGAVGDALHAEVAVILSHEVALAGEEDFNQGPARRWRPGSSGGRR